MMRKRAEVRAGVMREAERMIDELLGWSEETTE